MEAISKYEFLSRVMGRTLLQITAHFNNDSQVTLALAEVEELAWKDYEGELISAGDQDH